MLLAQRTRRQSTIHRSAAVLLIVLVVLAIFAAVGLAFVFYAESAANSSAAFKDAMEFRGPDVDPELAFAMFLRQFIFDCRDDASGVDSSLRGHSLLRTMYGLDYTVTGTTIGLPANSPPYSGAGRLHMPSSVPGGGDDYYLVNYKRFPQDLFVRHPERLGVTTTAPAKGGVDLPYVAFNAPYTAADLNSMFLAAMKADGTVLASSYHRDWTGFGPLAFTNTNWDASDPALKYKVMRPRPADHPAWKGKPGFPPPDDPGGDVRNRPPSWAGEGNDSIWIDIGAPIFTLPDGRRYTFLCAPLIVDLDGKINLNAAGNMLGPANFPASQPVWSPADINVSAVLTNAELGNLYLGAHLPNPDRPRIPGRYSQAKGSDTGDSRVFSASELNKIYRHGDTNSDALLGDLWQLLPANFQDVRKRNMITTLSFDRREAGLLPWLWTTPTAERYEMVGYVAGGPAVSPRARPSASAPAAAKATLGNDYAATLATVQRLDLNRKLTPYPPVDPNAGRITDLTAFRQANGERQAFAADLFKVLVRVTGAFDLTNYSSTVKPTTGELDALRYLSQIAVSIVDFIDSDDFITPFKWIKVGNSAFQSEYASVPGAWVYGTERPRVVLNEVYAHIANNSNDPGLRGSPPVATVYDVDLYVELCNPLMNDAALTEGGAARLLVPASGGSPYYPVYRLLITDKNKDLAKPDNTRGDPDGTILGNVDNEFATNPLLLPLNGAFASPNNNRSNVGFYWVGSAAFPWNGWNTTINAKGVRYQWPIPAPESKATPPLPTLLLQRLLCPYLPPDDSPGSPTYNPYITVDYYEDIYINIASKWSGVPYDPWPDSTIQTTKHWSVGRVQPYMAKGAQPQTVPQRGNQPKNTFFMHNFRPTTDSFPIWQANGTITPPMGYPAFDRLVHCDRNLISPIELLHVSGFAPHQLTQQFTGEMGGHQAPWSDDGARLYRFLEFVETAPRQAGANGPRVPGKINLNTVWDYEVFLALCDPQSGNRFTQADVDAVWAQLFAARNGGATGRPGPDARPFLPMSAGVVTAGDTQYPGGLGIGNTFLQSLKIGDGSDQPRLLELLTKIYNNLTTRSNCFAVWVTVGFFEVNHIDATGRIYLGQEMGRSEGRNIRHRMFAIVDRSVMDSAFVATTASAVLNQTLAFNPHSMMFKDLVPYFTIIE